MIILLNHRAGGAQREQVRALLVQYFRERGVDAVIHEVRTGAEITRLARQAVLDGEETVVAAGGDGTVGTAASALVDTATTLGVLPLGTLNHFARDLGIPPELEAAAHTALAGRIATIDVGELNGFTFVNNSSLGLYPSIAFERERYRGRGWKKWPAMAWASLSVFRRFHALDVRLEADGRGARLTTPFLFVGNNEYQVEGFDLGRRPSLDKGYLWVFVAPDRSSRWTLVRLTLLALFGRVRRDGDFHAFATRELWVGTNRPRLRAALDGEVRSLSPPLHYRSRPLALRVRVPAETG